MKRVITGTRKREAALVDQGFEFDGFEYDHDAQKIQRQLEYQGYEVRLLREQTDTPSLKLYSIWKRFRGE